MSSKDTNIYDKLNIKQKNIQMSENNSQELTPFPNSSRYINKSFNKKMKITKHNDNDSSDLNQKLILTNLKQTKNDENLKKTSQISKEENYLFNSSKEISKVPDKNDSTIFSFQAFNNTIKKSDVHFKNHPEYKDKSILNWENITNFCMKYCDNKSKRKKNNFNNRRFYYGRKNVSGLPYFYDISCTYMNEYGNKSEHSRHEYIVDQINKLRSYMEKSPENKIIILKDFLIKHNIKDVDKLTNYKLMSMIKFFEQEDIYKISSLLKPYLNNKDMLNDILENSQNLNYNFHNFQFDPSIKKFISNIDINNIEDDDKENNINKLEKMMEQEKKKEISQISKNIKFYISELMVPSAPREDYEENTDKDEIKVTNKNDFIVYKNKRKKILESMGILPKMNQKNFNMIKEKYVSPLLQKSQYLQGTNQLLKRNKFSLPNIRINNSVKNNLQKIRILPEKNYSSNVNLLIKDMTTELKNFEKKQQLQMMYRNEHHELNKKIRNSKSDLCLLKPLSKKNSRNNLSQCLSSNELELISPIPSRNTKRIDLEDIKKSQKITEYAALVHAKRRLKSIVDKNDEILSGK